MSPEDQRLFLRGTAREAVIADLQRIVRLCGTHAEAADALEVSGFTVSATLRGAASIGEKLLVGLYGPSGCTLPAEWAAEPAEFRLAERPADDAEGAAVADEGTPVGAEDVESGTAGHRASAAVARSDLRMMSAPAVESPAFDVQAWEVDSTLPQPEPCGCGEPPATPPLDRAPLDWRPLAIADFEGRIAAADATIAAAAAARDVAHAAFEASVAAQARLVDGLALVRELAA